MTRDLVKERVVGVCEAIACAECHIQCKSEQGLGILEDAVGFFEKYKKNLQALRVDGGSSSLKFRPVIIEMV